MRQPKAHPALAAYQRRLKREGRYAVTKDPPGPPTDQPIEVDPCIGTPLEGGVVHIEGPDGMIVNMTAKAALETARSLSDAAIDALIAKERPAKPDDKKSANS
jgi:hypothetical protein